ncbi:helix-turn-helix transcriptional regulator [Agrobacterium rhizogenes]|uniref:helix-turn-helix domain-containing protein n=1 Tax=Rhizobium rhizogenes TaxID=359 RepID=UPI00157258CA|nr:helix-turn-helix transcriptional regulator [Rhizobium rhizogenes]NTH14228.1 helix-turn-helix transcriptional regulator [Rhizobium rhizogenes]
MISDRSPTVAPSVSELDDYDRRILRLLYHGQSAKEIARYLAVSHRIIEYRITCIKRKLGARSATHAAALGLALDLEELRTNGEFPNQTDQA